MYELLHEKVVDAAGVVLDFVGKRGHLLRAAAVDCREVFLRIGVTVILQLELRVGRNDCQLLQVLRWDSVRGVGRPGRWAGIS